MNIKVTKTTNLAVYAGQRVHFNLTISPDGHEAPVGALVIPGAEPLAMEVSGDQLVTPELAPGLYLYEIRCQGVTVLSGHVNVYPSPLSEHPGTVTLNGAADISGPLVQCEVSLGETGPAGADGLSAYEIWLAAGNSGTETDFLASLVGPQGAKGDPGSIDNIDQAVGDVLSTALQPAVTSAVGEAITILGEAETRRTCSGTLNADARWIDLDPYHVTAGRLQSIMLPCRWTNSSNMTLDPVYLIVEQCRSDGTWVRIGSSQNAITQSVAGQGIWLFNDVPIDQLPTRIGCHVNPDGVIGKDYALGIRVATSPDGQVNSYYWGGARNYLTVVEITTVPTIDKFASAEHVADAVAHLTTDEHTALTNLLISGGGSITIDDTPTSGSSNAVSSGGVYNMLHSDSFVAGYGSVSKSDGCNVTLGYFSSATSANNSIVIGNTAKASSDYPTTYYQIAIGYYSLSATDEAVAIGGSASATAFRAWAIGEKATASAEKSIVFGSGGYIGDASVLAFNAGGSATDGKSTQLYLIPAGSNMANIYTGGAAGLGFVVLDHLSGSVVACGTIPLASICTQHTSDFFPTNVNQITDY